MDWSSLATRYLITRLCACISRSTKEDNDMSDINESPNGDIKSKVATEAKPRVKVKHLTRADTREFNNRMGLSDSYLVIGNTIKGGHK